MICGCPPPLLGCRPSRWSAPPCAPLGLPARQLRPPTAGRTCPQVAALRPAVLRVLGCFWCWSVSGCPMLPRRLDLTRARRVW
eukprot:7039985-Pyramimonas_sp.AAC.1